MRRKTGRKPEKQLGAQGFSLRLVDDPDKIVNHMPGCCSGCGADLDAAASAGVVRRQVTDIAPARSTVTEHRLHRRRCGCGAVSTGQKATDTTKLIKTANLVLPSLRAIEALQEDDEDDEGDPYDDLHHALEQLLPGSRTTANRRLRLIRDFLSLLTAAANTASETPDQIASSLVIAPAATACVLLSSDGSDRTEQRLRTHILIAAAALDPTLAGSYAADLPAEILQ